MKRNSLDIKTFFRKFCHDEGSITIFILIVMGTLLGIIFTFIQICDKKAESGEIDAIFLLSSRSILSEYNIPLKNMYGILAIDKSENEIEKKINFYLSENNPKINIKNIKAETQEYLLTNTENLQKEIIEYYKYILVKGVIDKIEKTKNDKVERTLKNNNIIQMLPSYDNKGNSIDLSKLAQAILNPDDFFDDTKDEIIVNDYILKMFSNNNNKVNENTFFRNEVEYIISGNFNDEKNYKEIKNKLLFVRNMANLTTIMQTPELKTEVTIAASLTGGVVGEVIIAEAWAMAEAINDIKILENGGKIPIIKNKDTWTVDIQNILENKESEYIDNKANTGLDYEAYLKMMLFFTDNDMKLLRMLDLIQINIQGYYDENFFIKSTSNGFNIEAVINGKKYGYEEKF